MNALPFEFDFKNPDYAKVAAWRVSRLKSIRENPQLLPALKRFYRDNPIQFIIDWGCTSDPRLSVRKLPTVLPFLPFPRQIEFLEWCLARRANAEHGVVVKSREVGVTWLAVALSCTLCLFNEGEVIGFGSRKEEYVDKSGDPKSIFFKIRQFLELLPPEFRGGFDRKRHSPYMRVLIPDTNSTLIGEAGDNLGRGGRTGIFWVDEAAHLQRGDLVEASLSETTDCRIDLSTPFGRANSFAHKVHAGTIPKFVFHWREDPRKDDDWYKKKTDRLTPAVIAQELDLNFDASVEGILIPSKWVQAAIDAHIALKVTPAGERIAGLDIADEGPDENAQAGRYGILLEHIESWSGGGSDIYATTQRSMRLCDEHNYPIVRYDGDGLGAGVRGDSRVLNEKREEESIPQIYFTPFRGSAGVLYPEQIMMDYKNEDLFSNAKAQAWWLLRQRFKVTYEAVREGKPFDPDEIISLSSKAEELTELTTELSQPTFSYNSAGKLIINKKPPGTKSPNRADAVMICYAPRTQGFFSE